MIFYLKEEFLSFDHFDIWDENENPVYSADREFFNFGKKLIVQDASGRQVAAVQHVPFSLPCTYALTIGACEGLSKAQRYTLELAAIVHDIACPLCREKYGNTNGKYQEQEGVPLPDEEYEMQHSKNGELQILYLAVSGNLHAMFVLKYVGGRNVARGLAVLQKENIRLLVTCQDPSLTAHHITEAYRLPEGMITVLDQEQCNAIKATPEDPEDTCCMIHLKAFASLTGGLQAADQAQNAESSATTVQMVSVLFSIIIAALLTSAGSIWELSVATVLMYQAAWSALSIAVCALKQHN